jgi:hypothetical protein
VKGEVGEGVGGERADWACSCGCCGEEAMDVDGRGSLGTEGIVGFR